MGMFTDEFGNIRWRAGGVLLAIALGIAFLPPMLRQKEIGHPRSGDVQHRHAHRVRDDVVHLTSDARSLLRHSLIREPVLCSPKLHRSRGEHLRHQSAA